MIKIFARQGSTIKVAILLPNGVQHVVRKAQIELHMKYGGDWVYVEDVKENEVIRFDDGKIYNGFEPGQPDDYRYCASIEKLD